MAPRTSHTPAFSPLQKLLIIALAVGVLGSVWFFGTGRSAPTTPILAPPPEPPFTCGVSTVSDIDGNVYDTILVGTQCWMQQNMRVGTMVTATTTQSSTTAIQKWCWNNSLANCMTTVQSTTPPHTYPDGGLYQWNMAMQFSTTSGAQGICPAGWHIPTDNEFKTLEMYLGMSQAQADATSWRGTDQGTQLKPDGPSGFEANLAGYGNFSSFYNRGVGGSLWSSSESGLHAWYRGVSSAEARVYRFAGDKAYGVSVRCLKDSSSDSSDSSDSSSLYYN